MQGFELWYLIPILFIVAAIAMFACFKRLSSGMMTNARCLNIAQSYERIAIRELAEKCEMTEDKVIDAIEWGRSRGMPITIEDGDFVRLGDPATWQKGRGTVVYMVICPHCGHKNMQGDPECDNCGASL
jgi:hypothetical protein